MTIGKVIKAIKKQTRYINEVIWPESPLADNHRDIADAVVELAVELADAGLLKIPPLPPKPPAHTEPHEPLPDNFTLSDGILYYIRASPFDIGAYSDLKTLTVSDRTGATLGGYWRYGKSSKSVWAPEKQLAVQTIPEDASNRKVIWNSTKAPGWDEWGPKWGMRGYNVTGLLENLTQYRCGDFEKGREGHAVYFNVYAGLTLRNVHAIQCGGQAIQLVWRDSETKIVDGGANEMYWVRIEDCSAIDCGVINEGSAVRASYPLSFFNPGQAIRIDNFKVRCDIPTFQKSVGACNSHGGVFIGPGQVYRRCPGAIINGLDIEVNRPDRACLKLWAVDTAIVNELSIVSEGRPGNVTIIDDCGLVEINNPITDINVQVKSSDKPFGQPITVLKVHAGEDWKWTK